MALSSTSMSLGMNGVLGCCIISGHLTLVPFSSLLLFLSLSKDEERNHGLGLVPGLRGTWLLLRALFVTI